MGITLFRKRFFRNLFGVSEFHLLLLPLPLLISSTWLYSTFSLFVAYHHDLFTIFFLQLLWQRNQQPKYNVIIGICLGFNASNDNIISCLKKTTSYFLVLLSSLHYQIIIIIIRQCHWKVYGAMIILWMITIYTYHFGGAC